LVYFKFRITANVKPLNELSPFGESSLRLGDRWQTEILANCVFPYFNLKGIIYSG